MSDNKNIRGPADRLRINVHEEYEITYWLKKFGVSRDDLADAVHAVGTSSQAVADYLGKRL